MTEHPSPAAPDLFDRESLFTELNRRGVGEWADTLRTKCARACAPEQHGSLSGWIDAYRRLPEIAVLGFDASGPVVHVQGMPTAGQPAELTAALRAFHPWRKGPFQFFDQFVDTEWRSDWKWARVAPHLDLRNRTVLDVGCGNGYYGWRMLAAGASLVVGLDPFLLYVMQFEAMNRYALPALAADRANGIQPQSIHGVLPLGDDDLPQRLEFFDVAFSMGVLYHRTSPIDHLQKMGSTLRPGGTLVLETLIVEGDNLSVLVPEDRYAKMRNVWFLPTVPMLLRWLRRAGFRNARVVDVTRTTTQEQRRTDWMTFESLSEFLDPTDSSRTIEGDPAPIRALILADRR